MTKTTSYVPSVVDALVSAGLVEPSRRDEAHRVVVGVLGAPDTERSSRGLLVEIAAYVGGALVVASIGLFLAQQWADFSDTLQVVVLAGIAVLLAAARVIAVVVGGGYQPLRTGRDEVRRRLIEARGRARERELGFLLTGDQLGPDTDRRTGGVGRGRDGGMGEHDALREPGRPARCDDERVSGLDGSPARQRSTLAVGLDDGSRCHGLDHQLPFGGREPGIDREGGIAVGPHALERRDELRSTRQVEGDEVGHGGSVDGRPAGPGLRSAP